jgi:hypothetical protein
VNEVQKKVSLLNGASYVLYLMSLASAWMDVRKTLALMRSSSESSAYGIASSVASVRVQYASRACCETASTGAKRPEPPRPPSSRPSSACRQSHSAV